MSTVHDFDAWYDDNVETTIPIKLMGKVWELPTDAPAAAVLRIQHAEQAIQNLAADEPLPEEFQDLTYEGMARALIGDELIDQWLAAGITMRMLQGISGRLYAYYTGITDTILDLAPDTDAYHAVNPIIENAAPPEPEAEARSGRRKPANEDGTPARDVEGQFKAMHAAFHEAGITKRQDRLDFAASTIHRFIDSTKDLSWEERGAVIDALKTRTTFPNAWITSGGPVSESDNPSPHAATS